MEYPKFFDEIEPFILKDELSAFLGATKDGIIKITYLDCVKLAGHSCPTVAGSYILTKIALKYLFKKQAQRASMKITFKEDKKSGVVGVIANVISFITGCNDEGGFSGIGGKFNRRDLLSFNAKQEGLVRFSLLDKSKFIELNLDTSVVPGNNNLKFLMQKALSGNANKDELLQFQTMWQERVEKMLLDKTLWNQIAKTINKG